MPLSAQAERESAYGVGAARLKNETAPLSQPHRQAPRNTTHINSADNPAPKTYKQQTRPQSENHKACDAHAGGTLEAAVRMLLPACCTTQQLETAPERSTYNMQFQVVFKARMRGKPDRERKTNSNTHISNSRHSRLAHATCHLSCDRQAQPNHKQGLSRLSPNPA